MYLCLSGCQRYSNTENLCRPSVARGPLNNELSQKICMDQHQILQKIPVQHVLRNLLFIFFQNFKPFLICYGYMLSSTKECVCVCVCVWTFQTTAPSSPKTEQIWNFWQNFSFLIQKYMVYIVYSFKQLLRNRQTNAVTKISWHSCRQYLQMFYATFANFSTFPF